MAQAATEHPTTGDRLLRWAIQTNEGRKITWAASKEAARLKVEARGHRVVSIEPAEHIGS